jgi:hypothetical protein
VRDNPFNRHGKKNIDRTKWKTLRDFVDEGAIESVLDTLESDRTKLDVSSLRVRETLAQFKKEHHGFNV